MSRRSRAARRSQANEGRIKIAGMQVEYGRAVRIEKNLRAELATARSALGIANRALAHHDVVRTSSVMQAAAELVKMVCPESIVRPAPAYATILQADTDSFTLTSRQLADIMYSRPNAPVTTRMLYDTMRVLRTKVRRDEFDRRIHLRIDLAGEAVGYAISEEALRDHDADELIIKFSEELAQMLVPQVQKALQQRGARWGDPRTFGY